jgi:hypothetical protein
MTASRCGYGPVDVKSSLYAGFVWSVDISAILAATAPAELRPQPLSSSISATIWSSFLNTPRYTAFTSKSKMTPPGRPFVEGAVTAPDLQAHLLVGVFEVLLRVRVGSADLDDDRGKRRDGRRVEVAAH